MFGTVKLTGNIDKRNFIYNGWWIAFDGKSEWSFGNSFAKYVLIFGVDNSLSSHTDNQKNNVLVLGEGATSGINGSFGSLKKNKNWY